MKSLKLSEYFEIIHPKYIYLRIIPHRSNLNNNTSIIAKTMADTYKGILKRVRKEQNKIIIETDFKISYLIDISKDNTDFYFLIPSFLKDIIKEKIIEVWSKSTIEELDHIKNFTSNKIVYQLDYKKDDSLSLKVDKRSNEPLNHILNVVNIMQYDDRVMLAYNFMPCSQYGFKEKYYNMLQKFNDKKPLDRHITFEFILKSFIGLIVSTLDTIFDVINDFLNNSSSKDESLYKKVMIAFEDKPVLSNSTLKKKDSNIINTQIAVISDSKNKDRKNNNALSLCQSFNVLKEDNELIYKRVRKNFNLEDYSFNLSNNLCSVHECKNFIQIPGYDLLKEHKIKNINITETEVPEELQQGVMCIGTNTCKGNKVKAYLSNDKDFRNLTLCVIAPTRSGKTTFLKNIAKDSIKAGECSILFDFCGECEFSNDVSKYFIKDKIFNIDCSNIDNLQGLGFNEIYPKDDSLFEVYKTSKMQTSNLVNFINSININNPLEPRMNRYLKAASMLVFINKGSFKDVFNVLQDYKIREQFINKTDNNQLDNMNEYILALNELDDYNKNKEKIGTKISFIQSILNRLDLIKTNAYMELMLKKDCTNNINLTHEIQKNQIICIKIPESMFSTDEEKDVYCTYWINKIWGALQQRHVLLKEEDRTKVNIFFDELYQVPCCQTFLKTKLNQIAKKTAKVIISCHSLEQIKYIRPALKSANTSYMLIAGCSKDNYNELKEELEPYELEDLLNLKRYYSLNLIKTNNGYSKFITKLPPLK